MLLQRIARLSDLLGAFDDAVDASMQAATLARLAQDSDAELDAIDAAAAARGRLGQLDAATELVETVRGRQTADTQRGIRTLVHSSVLEQPLRMSTVRCASSTTPFALHASVTTLAVAATS